MFPLIDCADLVLSILQSDALKALEVTEKGHELKLQEKAVSYS